VIVTHNLFRPLGYREPKPGPSFELIATVVDPQAGKSKALIRNNKTQQIYYVVIGEEFAGAKVERIKSLQVTLRYDGKLKEIRASKDSFINNSSRGGSKSFRR
ncbi:MAG: hypothetical protein O7E52_01035, partial [Candidatus Poribacteria bacterium]|nr:hypothetical protein [Candidatus Poribacteria bacterium]